MDGVVVTAPPTEAREIIGCGLAALSTGARNRCHSFASRATGGCFTSGYLVPTQLPDLPHNYRVSSFVCRTKCFFDYQADGAGSALRSSITLPLAGYRACSIPAPPGHALPPG
jgi:hypothetical protein